MPAVLETGLDFIETDNENDLPCVKGYNIINGILKLAKDKRIAWESFHYLQRKI